MSRILQICLIILVALTVGHSQVFGVQRGFICKDGAQPQETSATHCHRTGKDLGKAEAHTAPLPTSLIPFAPCDYQLPSPACPSDEASEHTSQKVDFEPIKLTDDGGVAAPHFIPVATLDDIATFEYLLALFASQPIDDSLPQFQEEAREHGATSALVAESVILLV